MRNDEFLARIKVLAEKFMGLDKDKTIKIVTHHDSDGIASAAIIIKMLKRLNRNFSLTVVPQVDDTLLKAIQNEGYNVYLFLDLGSTMIKPIQEVMYGRDFFLLDHHNVDEFIENACNPKEFDIDGSVDISASGIAYYFAKFVDSKNEDLVHLAVIGAIGDMQDRNGFVSYNKQLLDLAIEQKKLIILEDIKFYGAQSKPLHKVLESTTMPFIPGVSGSESGSVKLLQSCGIDVKHGNEYTKLYHLLDDQKERLISKILERSQDIIKDNIFGEVYLLESEIIGSPIRDTREFSTMLNACGRLNKASYGIGACLNDKKLKKKAVDLLKQYKRQIIDAFQWFNENKNTEDIIESSNYIIFNAKDNINPNLISVITTIIANSNMVKPNCFVVGLSRTNDNISKVSFRLSKNSDLNIDLHEVLSGIEHFISFGGHYQAASGLIKSSKEGVFFKNLKSTFKENLLIENI